MACANISVTHDGILLCWDTRPPTEIGPANHPPSYFSQEQIDAVNYWHRITAGLARMDKMFEARVALTASMKQPDAQIDIFFKVPIEKTKAAERLDAELKMLVTDFHDMGCQLIYYPHTISHSRKLNRKGEPVSDWKPSEFSWQISLRIPESRWGDEDIYGCLKSLISSVRRTRLSDFLVPAQNPS